MELHSVTPCACLTHLRTEGASKYEEVLKAAEVPALSPSSLAAGATSSQCGDRVSALIVTV